MTSKSKPWHAKLKQAFAVKQESLDPKANYAILDKAASFIAKRHLQAPAIMALQSLTPLSFVGSQALIVLEPFLGVFFSEKDYQELINILEHRDGIELFIQKIETAGKTNQANKKSE